VLISYAVVMILMETGNRPSYWDATNRRLMLGVYDLSITMRGVKYYPNHHELYGYRVSTVI
jgi:hypothetical protein